MQELKRGEYLSKVCQTYTTSRSYKVVVSRISGSNSIDQDSFRCLIFASAKYLLSSVIAKNPDVPDF